MPHVTLLYPFLSRAELDDDAGAGPEGRDRRSLEPWAPLTFAIRIVTIVVRDPPPRDVFRTFAEVPLGRALGA